jgi:anthranilate synthase component 1
MLFDKVIAFDNFKQKIVVIVNMEISEDQRFIEENYA